MQDLKKRRQLELLTLTALTGTNLHNWQEDAAAKNDEEKEAEAQYATIIKNTNT